MADTAFELVVESAPDAIVLVDRGGVIMYANARTEELFGYDRSELVGQRTELLVPIELRSMHTIHREIYQERPERRPMGTGLDLFGQRKDGSIFPVEIGLSPVHGGETATTVAVVRDVTRQRRAEEALRRSEERHRLLNERSDSVIFRYRVSPSAAFEYVSSAVLRCLGHAPEEFYVSSQLVFELALPEDREALGRVLSGQTPAATLRFVADDGSVRWMEMSVTAVLGPDGGTIALEGSARDVTDRRAADEMRLRLQAEVEVQSERYRLAGDLHDDTLQTIYALGLGLHAMRDDDTLTREDVIDRTVSGLNDIIGSLRNYMQRLRGSEDPAAEAEPLAKRFAALLQGTGTTDWTIEIEPELELDAATERQLYLLGKELVSNVQRHASANSARFALGVGDGGNVELVVSDDGVGFERSEIGSGSFGLRSIALRADAVGAKLRVESTPGAGTRVSVSIPKAPARGAAGNIDGASDGVAAADGETA